MSAGRTTVVNGEPFLRLVNLDPSLLRECCIVLGIDSEDGHNGTSSGNCNGVRFGGWTDTRDGKDKGISFDGNGDDGGDGDSIDIVIVRDGGVQDPVCIVRDGSGIINNGGLNSYDGIDSEEK
ncbi:hypothetical protein EW145_g5701 [Phellinidium pouzarii]|uniref:Uncharacterized protein n=1 Tax=Phellinidium pouzarii TaxID=167371 RepID=A0A4S4KZ38_9AGAM|nr:hypothetical protein EW145_g5701 [Phellinidium pouzarii]